MTRIYLIRHGEAEGNVYRRAHGWCNGKITAKGLRQIDALAERFKDIPVDAVYSSDLSRAAATAGAITKYHRIPLHTDRRLREINMGEWEDVPFGNLSWYYPEQMHYFNNDPDKWRIPGAETFPQAVGRVKEALSDIAARHEGQTVVCVSHGMVIRSLLAELLGIQSSEISAVPHGDNTSVSLIEAEKGEMKPVFCSSAEHLTEELSTFARQSWWRGAGQRDLGNLRFEVLDPNTEGELYKRLYGETWLAVHGTMEGFSAQAYLDAAKRHARRCPDSIIKAMSGEDVVGITEIDVDRCAAENKGWISLCYVAEDARRQMLGVQLLGHAVSAFHRLGRSAIRLTVFEENRGAIAFYKEYGFETVGRTPGTLGELLIMEKKL